MVSCGGATGEETAGEETGLETAGDRGVDEAGADEAGTELEGAVVGPRGMLLGQPVTRPGFWGTKAAQMPTR